MGDTLSWVRESRRRGEKLVVIIRDEDTGEEAVTTMSPEFVAGVVSSYMRGS